MGKAMSQEQIEREREIEIDRKGDTEKEKDGDVVRDGEGDVGKIRERYVDEADAKEMQRKMMRQNSRRHQTMQGPAVYTL